MRKGLAAPWQRQLTAALAFALLWYLLWSAAAIAGVDHYASLWYPPAALTLAFALTLSIGNIGVILLGALLGAVFTSFLPTLRAGDAPWPLAMGLGVGVTMAHVVPYLAGTWVVARGLGAWWRPGAVRGAFAWLVAIPTMAVAAAVLGVSALVAGGRLASDQVFPLVLFWAVGDALAALTLAPFLALLLARPLAWWLGCGVNPVSRKLSLRPLLAPSFLALLTAGLLAVSWPWFGGELVDTPGVLMTVMAAAAVAVLLIGLTQPPGAVVAAIAIVATATVALGPLLQGPEQQAEVKLLLVVLVLVGQLGGMIRELNRRATHDPLTGLANRRRLIEVTRRRYRQRHPFALVLIDLDHFKQINDRFGHHAGDRVLRAVAERLLARAPKGSLVARMGGEEFALVLTGDATQAAAVADDLRRSLHGVEMAFEGVVVPVRASFGVASGGPETSSQQLLQRADEALYAAKRGGRDRVVVCPAVLPPRLAVIEGKSAQAAGGSAPPAAGRLSG
ncbi:MAG: GGDEF domain-containing protein [Geminicoccaceae bacterium]|nr:MAG: GGDEF domain-containing protein [Geminicoccaceae bacterium]